MSFFDALQIKSVDYVYEDGQQVQSTRLPGYSGVSGLDAEQDAEDRKMDEFEAVSNFASCACHVPVQKMQKASLLLWGASALWLSCFEQSAGCDSIS